MRRQWTAYGKVHWRDSLVGGADGTKSARAWGFRPWKQENWVGIGRISTERF